MQFEKKNIIINNTYNPRQTIRYICILCRVSKSTKNEGLKYIIVSNPNT